MQRRAKFIVGGITVLTILALGRYGMIDSQRSAPAFDGAAPASTWAWPACAAAGTPESAKAQAMTMRFIALP